jgi:hypothetical protein
MTSVDEERIWNESIVVYYRGLSWKNLEKLRNEPQHGCTRHGV